MEGAYQRTLQLALRTCSSVPLFNNKGTIFCKYLSSAYKSFFPLALPSFRWARISPFAFGSFQPSKKIVIMATSLLPLLFLFSDYVFSQSLNGWGVSGGSGPRGGIGDGAHPVLEALAYVTDGLVPTASNQTRQLARGQAPVLVRVNNETACSSSGLRKIVVDSLPKGARQEMLGFGHSWTDSAVEVFDQLEPDVRDRVMADLFGQDGNNMGFMRHTVGSSDLSGEQYSYNDNGPSFNEGQPDPDLSEFSLGPQGTRMAEYIAMMGEYKGDVFLYGTTWSYPGWMKNNYLFVAPNTGGYHLLLNNSFNPAYMQQAIDYYAKYVDAYAEFGVKINGMSPQNEPLNYQGAIGPENSRDSELTCHRRHY